MTPVGRADYRGQDRRERRRREDDSAEHELLEGVVDTAPQVNRLESNIERAGKFGGSLLVLGAVVGGLLGGAGTALGMRLSKDTDQVVPITARVNASAARIDSLVRAVETLRSAVGDIAYVQCVQVRRSDPDLARGDCTPVQPRAVR